MRNRGRFFTAQLRYDGVSRGGRLEIDYKTLERLLVVLFGLSETQRGALLGRFKYLQRLGRFGAHAASRGRARYKLEDLLKLVVIFELIDVGCAPAHALRVVRTHWSDLRVNLAYAWKDTEAYLAGKAVAPMMWTVIPHTLSELGAGGALLAMDTTDRAGELEPGEVLKWRAGPALAGERHAIFVHLPRLLASCREALGVVAPSKIDSFAASLDRLARTYCVGEAR